MRLFSIQIALALALVGCDSNSNDEVAPGAGAGDRIELGKLLAPLPETAALPESTLEPALVSLGRMLFHETELSNPAANAGERISCSGCHALDQYGVDGLPRSIGILGTPVPVNAPSVYNAALHFRQFWDGRAATVEEQALGPITAVPEMGFTDSAEDRQTVLDQLTAAGKGYPALFAAAFPAEAEPFTFENIGRAIGAFERTLLTPAPIDELLRGELDALTPAEERGLGLFLRAGRVGCVSCHSGVVIGGRQFRGVAELVSEPLDGDLIAEAAFADVPEPLKVPSLRNVTETGPYFHNGSVASLEEAVRLMGTYQLGVSFSAEEIADLVAFLRLFTGELPPL